LYRYAASLTRAQAEQLRASHAPAVALPPLTSAARLFLRRFNAAAAAAAGSGGGGGGAAAPVGRVACRFERCPLVSPASRTNDVWLCVFFDQSVLLFVV
jgi:hypothetical protein